MQSNVFSLDRTTSESEEIGESTNLVVDQPNSQEDIPTRISQEETDIPHEFHSDNDDSAESASGTEADSSSNNDADEKANKKKKIAKIASVSGLGIFTTLVGAAVFFTPEESNIGIWRSVVSETTALFDGEEKSKDKMFEPSQKDNSSRQAESVARKKGNLGSINEAVLLEGLEEVALSGNLSDEQQINLVVQKLQMDRLQAGGKTLSPEEVVSVTNIVAGRLQIDGDQAASYADKMIVQMDLEHQLIDDLKNTTGVSEREKVSAFLLASGQVEADFDTNQVRAGARKAALQLGADMTVADQVAELKIAENQAYAGTIASLKTSSVSNDEKIYQVVNSVRNAHAAISIQQLNPKAKADLSGKDFSLSKHDASVYINNTAAEVGASPLEREIASARVSAELNAELKGAARNEQIIAGKTAAALIESERNGLTGYDAAMFLVEKVGGSSVLTESAKALDLSKSTQAIVKAQVDTRDGLQKSSMKISANEAVAYIGASVARTAQDQKLSVSEQESIAMKAIGVEAKRYKLTEVEKGIEEERVKAIINARAAGLSELEVLAASEGAAAIAKQRHNNLTQSQLKVIGDQAAQNVILAAGLDADVETQMVKRTLSFTSTSVGKGAQNKSADLTALEIARNEADKKGLTALEREAFVAKSLTEYRAKELGLSPVETEIAIVKAQAGARARAMGMSESRQADIANRAASAKMEAMGYSDQQQNQIVVSIDRIGSQSGYDSSDNASLENSSGSVLSSGEFSDSLKSLEKQLAGLSVKVAEFELVASQATTENAILKNMIHQLQASVSANSIELNNQREKNQSDNAKRTANAGWLSNRLCENEAATGNFSNPEICKAIYAKYQTRLPTPAEPVDATYRPQTFNRSTQQDGSRQYAELPTTARAFDSGGSSRLYGEIPQTVFREQQASSHVSQDVCSGNPSGYAYTVINDNYALITNQSGNTLKVVRESFVPGLGAVLEFQSKTNPRFIVFENGIVCRKGNI